MHAAPARHVRLARRQAGAPRPGTPVRRLARAVAAAALALGLAAGLTFAGALTASAEPPVTLGTTHVLDRANVLSAADTSEIEAATVSLASDHEIDLFVVFVDDFTSPSDAETWANDVASQNNLGPSDYLLAVAVTGRSYYLSGDTAGPVTGTQLSSIENTRIEPQLRNNSWSGAALAAANGLAAAVGGGTGGGTTTSGTTGSTTTASGGSGGIVGGLAIVLVVILILVVGVIVLVFVRASRRPQVQGARTGTHGVSGTQGGAGGGEVQPAQPVDELAGLSLVDLERRAGSALVQTDDAIQTSTEELGFAVAQYGTASAAPFQTAIDQATATLKQAFLLKQKLDDSEPDTDAERRDWNGQIIRLAAEANRLLDEQADAFDELRALEKNIPGAAAKVQAEAAAVQPRLSAAEVTLADLASKYTDAALGTVRDNTAQASERLTFAATALAAAQTSAAAGNTSDAAVGVRAAEDSVAQAGLLLDAVDRVAADLASTRAGIDALIANLQQDIADAHALALAAGGDPTGQIAATAVSTQQTVTDVQNRLAAGAADPHELTQKLELANRDIDGVLNAVRTTQANAQRAAAALSTALATAGARISAANDFISARRGAVGAEARTRLAEASRLLDLAQATAVTDTTTALAQAQHADELAAQATQLAQNDVGGFGDTYGGFGGGPGGAAGYGNGGGNIGAGNGGGYGNGNGSGYGRGGGGNGAGGMIGAVLGGIIIDSVLSGGRGGGGGGLFGGGGGGDPFGGMFGGGNGGNGGGGNRDRDGGGIFGGGGGGGGGGFFGGGSAGSFGGSGTRSRRGGGRF